VELAPAVIAFACSRHIRKLLVYAPNLTGFESTDVTLRYFYIHEWERPSVRVVEPRFMFAPHPGSLIPWPIPKRSRGGV